MKSTGLIVLISLFALGLSADASLKEFKVVPFGVVDQVVENALQSLRTFLEELTFEDVNEKLSSPMANLTLVAENVELKGAELFETVVLDTTLLPLQIRNLTLTWKEVSFEADYKLDGTFDLDVFNGVKNLKSDGKFKFTVYDVTATVGAKFELKEGKVQVQPKGLFGFDARLNKANVTMGHINGSEEKAEFLGFLVSHVLPDVVDSFSQALFEINKDFLIDLLNLYLSSQ